MSSFSTFGTGQRSHIAVETQMKHKIVNAVHADLSLGTSKCTQWIPALVIIHIKSTTIIQKVYCMSTNTSLHFYRPVTYAVFWWLHPISRCHSLICLAMLFHKIDWPQSSQGQVPFSLILYRISWTLRWFQISAVCLKGYETSSSHVALVGWEVAYRKERLACIHYWNWRPLTLEL